MKVVCIEDTSGDELKRPAKFTINKIYEILAMRAQNLDNKKVFIPYIKDDVDEFHMYESYKELFTTIEENRDNKINKIFKK